MLCVCSFFLASALLLCCAAVLNGLVVQQLHGYHAFEHVLHEPVLFRRGRARVNASFKRNRWWGRRDLNSQPSGITTPEPLHPNEVVRKYLFCSGARLYAMRLVIPTAVSYRVRPRPLHTQQNINRI